MNNKFTNFFKNHWFNIIIFLIGALGVLLRVHVYLFNRSLWMDEAALANNLLLPHSILNNMTYQQAAPPLFKLISLINIKLFGETEYIFRLFPMICGILSIPIFWLIVKRALDSKLAQAAAMTLFSINYLLIYYSSEFKQYSTDVLCALVLIWLALKFDIKNCSIRALVLLSAVNASVFWFSHGSLFVMAGIFVVNLFCLIKSDFKKYRHCHCERPTGAWQCISGFLRWIAASCLRTPRNDIKSIKRLFVLYLPALFSFIAFYFLHLKTIHDSSFMHEYWAEYFMNNLNNVQLALSSTISMFFFPIKNWLLIFIIAAFGCWVLFKKDKKKASILTSTIFLTFILSFCKIYPFAYRLSLYLAPIFIICYSTILSQISKTKKFKSFFICSIFVFGILPYLTYYPQVILKPNIWLREEIRTLYEYLEVRLKPDDIIFTANDMYQQNKYYMRKFKFPNQIIETRLGSDVPFDKMQKGKRYMILFGCYCSSEKRDKFPKIIKWLGENTRVISQYVYYQNYVLYVEKL